MPDLPLVPQESKFTYSIFAGDDEETLREIGYVGSWKINDEVFDAYSTWDDSEMDTLVASGHELGTAVQMLIEEYEDNRPKEGDQDSPVSDTD